MKGVYVRQNAGHTKGPKCSYFSDDSAPIVLSVANQGSYVNYTAEKCLSGPLVVAVGSMQSSTAASTGS